MWSSRTATFSATGSISRPGSKGWPNLAGSVSRASMCLARVQEDAVGRLDLIFADLGEQTLKNIARPVQAYRVRAVSAPSAPALSLPLPDKPSIAVLPFQNIGGDPEQEYFADGMVEEIITALSRIRWLFVIARNSSFTYKDQAVDVKRVGRELGVRYVLEGSVRKGGGPGADYGAADRSRDRHASLGGQLRWRARRRVRPAGPSGDQRRRGYRAGAASRRSPPLRRPTNDLTAYDLYLHALPNFALLARESISVAVDLLDRAIACDPSYGPALALAAMCTQQLHMNGWTDSPDAIRNQGLDHARRALRAAENDPFILTSAALVIRLFRGGHRGSDRVDEPLFSRQPEFRIRLASQRPAPAVCRATRYRDRARGEIVAAQSARPACRADDANRRRISHETGLRLGGRETTGVDPGTPRLRIVLPPSRGKLCPYGTAR